MKTGLEGLNIDMKAVQEDSRIRATKYRHDYRTAEDRRENN